MIERVSTDGLRLARRAQDWNEIYSGILAAADFIPYEENFSAGLMVSRVGPLSVARLATGRCAIRRTAAHIDRSSPKLYSIIVQANGSGSFAQFGNRAMLRPGDFALCDHSLPHLRLLERGADTLLIRVPAEVMGDYLPRPERLCGRRLPGSMGLVPAAALLARGLWANLEQGLPSKYEDCVAHHLLELIAISYATVFGSTEALDRCSKVRAYIDDRLHDPGFNLAMLAAEMALSPAEIHELFAEYGESLRSYLLRRRLDEATRRLRDERWRGHTIAEIAHCCGFTSNAMFARVFRKRYDVTPTEYRGMAATPRIPDADVRPEPN